MSDTVKVAISQTHRAMVLQRSYYEVSAELAEELLGKDVLDQEEMILMDSFGQVDEDMEILQLLATESVEVETF